ncbi:hypothetical protein DSO57_1023799 [Entomophthora muscae]|uniref:Uncharacterized protein n=1 Tax=Entomophthora muscae TaxID=34485 RepID=A0ACC2SRX6_9FUNG|nr:hypothetical protein DSO57_1023799 [Entomophthora muscae]
MGKKSKSKKEQNSVTSKPKKKASKKANTEKETLNDSKEDKDGISLEVIKGFNVLPVLVPNPNSNKESNSSIETIHYLYFKKHLVNLKSEFIASERSTEVDESQLLPPGRTLFRGCRVAKVLIRTPNSLCTVPRSESLDKSNFFKKTATPASKNLGSLFPSPIQLATGRLEDTLLTYPNYAYVVLKEVAGVEKLFNYTLKKAPRDAESDSLDSETNFSRSSLVQLRPLASKSPSSGIESKYSD